MIGQRLGCIADDYTGGTDVAAALRRAGLRTALLFGVPEDDQALPDCDAAVVALKSRTLPAAEAVAESLAVRRWLVRHGVERLYFKYCSTFDSTDDGNIGPVTDALLDSLPDAARPDGPGPAMTLICPASPEHARTTYQGHLFVGDRLLSESSLRHHPLTPMTDPDLVRVLGRQTRHRVGLLALPTVAAGTDAVRARLAELRGEGVRHVVVDAVSDADLLVVASASAELPVLTGGAGLAGAIGTVTTGGAAATGTAELPPGPGLVLAGSCSAATLAQVDLARSRFPSYRLDPATIPDPEELLVQATEWLELHLGGGPVLVYSSASQHEREAAVAAMGPDTAGTLERTLGLLAQTAVERGVRRVVVAGGETSGAVVAALGVRTVLVDAEADRGVPWCVTTSAPSLGLLLKSGNFGRPDLLVRAMDGASE